MTDALCWLFLIAMVAGWWVWCYLIWKMYK